MFFFFGPGGDIVSWKPAEVETGIREARFERGTRGSLVRGTPRAVASTNEVLSISQIRAAADWSELESKDMVSNPSGHQSSQE